jgi:hypothetical protein
MRGENPISFPVRLFPQQISTLSSYPTQDPRGVLLLEGDSTFFEKLPMVPIPLVGDTLRASLQFMNALSPDGKGISTIKLEQLVHAGNLVVPSVDGLQTAESYVARASSESIWTVMDQQIIGGELKARAKSSIGAKWLTAEQLPKYSPKFAFLLERARTAEGCMFVYTRFVGGGALPIALVLEANGYTAYNKKNILLDGIQAPGGRQCALCPNKEQNHKSADHSFSPAYYGILTGQMNISPHNEKTILAQRDSANKDGRNLKVLIGSQIASEGVDLRFVRETHVIDSWYHLNKTEQILGRAIRFLSHCALPASKRNNTVYLYTAVIPSEESSRETADLYSYRIGFRKAVQIGRVTRIMKQSAIDCNINHQAIVIKGQPPIEQVDSQRILRRGVDINDMPFTAVCDWIETCDYTCKPQIDLKSIAVDDSTYDEYSARWRINQMKERIRILFQQQPFYQSEDMWNLLSDIPRLAAVDLLHDIVDNTAFQVTYKGISGYIRYCNKYYLFQPNVYADLTIPLAIRAAKFPVKRDGYRPIEYDEAEWIEEAPIEPTSSIVSIDSLWIAITRWVGQLTSTSTYTVPPVEIEHRRLDASQQDKERLDQFLLILEMIQWFHQAFHQSTNQNPTAFRKALIFYFWDEWLTLEEQRRLVGIGASDVLLCIQENQYQFGKTLVNRYLDTKSSEIQFDCENGVACVKSYVDEIKRDTREPMRAFELNKRTTGFIYGFMAPKYGQIVFKTAEAPDIGGAIPRGKECGNVSNMKPHLKILHSIGEVLARNHKTNFGLDRSDIKNSTRICTVMDLLLRLLDAEEMERKRWFFRPVMSYYTGHKGISRSSMAK